MPAWVHGKKNEELWDKAKKIVEKEYKLTEKDGEKYWQLVSGVYKKSGGEIYNAQNESMRNILDGLFKGRVNEGTKEAKINPKEVSKAKKMIDKGDRYAEFLFNDLKKKNPNSSDDEILQIVYNTMMIDEAVASVDDIQKGDRIKVMKHFTRSVAGDVFTVLSVPKPENVERENYVLLRLKKDGTPTVMSMDNGVGVRKRSLEKYLNDGTLRKLEPNEPQSFGEVPISDVKLTLQMAGIDKKVGMSAAKMVSSSGPYYRIDLGRSKGNDTDALYDEVKKALNGNDIQVEDQEDSVYNPGKWFVYVRKVQGGN